MSAIDDIAAERLRQIKSEGWTPEHDDEHDAGQLIAAAATYCLEATFDGPKAAGRWFNSLWPWDRRWFKREGGRRRMLVKAGALIVAELDRLDREAITQPAR